jgi:peptidoglycan hydrolase-like protein with peptidoglycan-binding domain
MPRSRTLAAFVATAVLATSAIAALPAGRADAFTTVVYNGAGTAPRIGIIGDSTIAALRWTNTFEPLRQFNFVYDAESCRRTATPSCRGREGYQPENVLTTMRRLSGRWGSLLVIMGGYDDPGFGFASAVDAVMAEAARQGIPTVMWLTLRTADVSYVGPTFASNTFTFRDNNRILLQKSIQYGDRLQIADWATYSASRSDWFYGDGIHFRPSGAAAVASYIASTAARVLGGASVTPPPGPPTLWPSVERFDRGHSVVVMQRALIDAGYGFFGGASGIFGGMTEAAVRRFQQAFGLPVTGTVDSRTAERLGLLSYSGVARAPVWRRLRRGMSGTVVTTAQQILDRRGFNVAGGATGVYDVHLYNAVVAFQRKHGLPVTGMIDELTARKIGVYSGTWVDLRLGISGTRVTQAQRALIAAGVPLVGGATGRYDSRTNTAVRSFQIGQGLPVTGVIDATTAARLGLLVAPERSEVWTNLTVQSRGAAVANAQREMIRRGIYLPGGSTGIFEGFTKNAVINFQRRNGLPVTGIVDHGTARRLGLFDTADVDSNWQNLRLFAVDPLVARAERGLIAAGYPVYGGANNVFDKYTYSALRRFQADRGLPVTGIITWSTARALGVFAPAPTALVTLSVAAAPVATPSSNTTTSTAAPTTTTLAPTTTTLAPTTTTSTSTSSTILASSSSAAAGEAGGAVGDLIWHDVNGDGVQQVGEPGVAEVVVRLLDSSWNVVVEDISDQNGSYELPGVAAGTYVLEIDLPEDQVPTVADRGEDDQLDSDLTRIDFEARTARSEPFTIDGFRDDLDVGLIIDPDGGTEPAPSSTEQTGSTTEAPNETTIEPEPPDTSVAASTSTVAPSTTDQPMAPTTSTTPPEPSTAVPTTAVAATTTVAG